MKPYQEHLKSILSFGETVSPTRKPVFRSSAIFPVIDTVEFSTQIVFMGYWLRKRNIPEVTLLISLRNEEGVVIQRKSLIVDKVKAYKIELPVLLAELKRDKEEFTGSLELEVFSTRDMVFPYPAFVINFMSKYGITAVHTTGRIYNDIEDMQGNVEYKVPESGFDIHSGPASDPFFSFVNGPFDNSGKVIRYEIIDEQQQIVGGQILPKSLLPYQTCFIYLRDHIDIDRVLKGGKGTIRLWLDYEGFFTRIIAGNFNGKKAVSITHSFYDSSSVNDEKAYQDNLSRELHDSYVFIPVYIDDDFYTQVIYYPIYSLSAYTMSLIFFNQEGNKLKELKEWKKFGKSDNAFFSIDINALALEFFTETERSNIRGLMISNDWDGKNIPTRIKYGLNIGLKNRIYDLPTNICFAPETANPKITQKPGTFKWAPLLNSFESEIIITNCGSYKDYNRAASLSIDFFRELDDKVLHVDVTITAYSQYVINVEKMENIKTFLGGTTGWVTISSDNPFVNAWYFDFNRATGVVAGDHSF